MTLLPTRLLGELAREALVEAGGRTCRLLFPLESGFTPEILFLSPGDLELAFSIQVAQS